MIIVNNNWLDVGATPERILELYPEGVLLIKLDEEASYPMEEFGRTTKHQVDCRHEFMEPPAAHVLHLLSDENHTWDHFFNAYDRVLEITDKFRFVQAGAIRLLPMLSDIGGCTIHFFIFDVLEDAMLTKLTMEDSGSMTFEEYRGLFRESRGFD